MYTILTFTLNEPELINWLAVGVECVKIYSYKSQVLLARAV